MPLLLCAGADRVNPRPTLVGKRRAPSPRRRAPPRLGGALRLPPVAPLLRLLLPGLLGARALDQLDQREGGRVPVPHPELHDARVAAVAGRVARRQLLEE